MRSRYYSQAMKMMSATSFDEKVVLQLLAKAIQKGDPRAAYAYANWYMFGPKPKKNDSKAVELLHIAAEGKIPEALFNLGIAYEKGKGTKKNVRAAYLFYLRAALAGEAEAFYEIGRCYCYGIGVTIDKEQAMIWLDKAKDLGVDGNG